MPDFRKAFRKSGSPLASEAENRLAFKYMLAEHLHKTVGEVECMAHEELVGWSQFFHVRQKLRELEETTERARADRRA